MSDEIRPVALADFNAEAVTNGGHARITMTGNADLRVKDELERFLEQVHTRVEASGERELAVDLRSLEFMNSTCFKSLLTWIGRIQSLAEDKRYRLRILSNPEMYWQRRSLHALRCFATDLITVEE